MNNRSFTRLALVLLVAQVLHAQVQDRYVNYGYVYDATQIPLAVVNFTNRGTIQITNTQPFETFGTLNYVNKPGTFWNSGTMVASPGWRFTHKPLGSGVRQMASYFLCDNGAIIMGLDPGSLFVFYENTTYPLPPVVAPVDPSYLIVWATNIVVRGGIVGSGGGTRASLVVGPNGLLELKGVNIDLTRAGIEVLPVWATPLGSLIVGDPPTNFIPDIAIQDVYWAQANFTDGYRLNSALIWNGVVAQSQDAPATPRPAPSFALYYPVADSYLDVPPGGWLTVTVTNVVGPTTNIPGTGGDIILITNYDAQVTLVDLLIPTNIIKGAVFADASPGFGIGVGFPGGSALGRTAAVLLSGGVTNVVTMESAAAYLYIEDTLASSTNRGLVWNWVGAGAEVMTARPVNYYLDRNPWSFGDPGNWGYPEPDFFLSSGAYLLYPDQVGTDAVTNAFLPTGDYAAYSAYVDNVVSRPAPLPGATVTNLPGRVTITASNLDLSFTRIRGEGFIKITAENLISTTNAVIDCENLYFDLDNKKGTLVAQNLAKEQTRVFRGQVYLWSAVWSNTAIVILTNNYAISNITIEVPGPEGTTNYVTNFLAFVAPLTNQAGMRLHAFLVNATELGSEAPVYVHEFITRSTNAVIKDNITVIEKLLLLGKSLTVDGRITIPGTCPPVNPFEIGYWEPIVPLQNWCYTNAPNLIYLTNRGEISVYNEAHFGDDRPARFEYFGNFGTINAASILVRSVEIENTGLLQCAAYQELWADTVKLDSGQSTAGGDLVLKAKVVKLNNYRVQVGGCIEFVVTNSLADAGPASGNTISVQDGFRLLVKPQVGDLLGTTINSTAPNVPAIEIWHVWAGTNRGPTSAGYTNNVALGTLKLASRSWYPLFYFAGTAKGPEKNALYVDVLDISDLGLSYIDEIMIETNLVIYYAAARVGFTVPPHPNGQVQLPEEYLDGQFGGRLRWVRDYAGPSSSVAVLVDGKTVYMNRALRNSRVIDSDGDGLPNYYDATPLGGLSIMAALVPATNTVGLLGFGKSGPEQMLAISWFARSNGVYRVEYITNLQATNWSLLMNFTNSVRTNRWVTVLDTNAPAAGPQRFYRVCEIRK